MDAIKYFTSVLPDGHIPIPEEVRKQFPFRKGEKLEVILSYITIKSREEEILSLQKRMQEAAKRTRKRYSLKELDRLVHEIRQR